MYNKALSLLLIFSLAFNIAFVGIWLYNRQRPVAPLPAGRHGGQERAGRQPMQALRLRDDQRRHLAELRGRARAETARLEADIQKQQERLLQLLAADQPDWKAVQDCEQRIAAGQKRLRELSLEQLRALRDILTPEQRRVWLEMMKARGGRGAQQGMGLRQRAPEGRSFGRNSASGPQGSTRLRGAPEGPPRAPERQPQQSKEAGQ